MPFRLIFQIVEQCTIRTVPYPLRAPERATRAQIEDALARIGQKPDDLLKGEGRPFPARRRKGDYLG